jgi:hypothetical protein
MHQHQPRKGETEREEHSLAFDILSLLPDKLGDLRNLHH